MQKLQPKKCTVCKKGLKLSINRDAKRKNFCSKKCLGFFNRSKVGALNQNWKGGRFTDKRYGYVWIYKPGFPGAQRNGKYALEHRVVMSEYLGRPLKTFENVHHKNDRRNDNKISNLELWITHQPQGIRVKDLLKLYSNSFNKLIK